jgi:hypothetical protein
MLMTVMMMALPLSLVAGDPSEAQPAQAPESSGPAPLSVASLFLDAFKQDARRFADGEFVVVKINASNLAGSTPRDSDFEDQIDLLCVAEVLRLREEGIPDNFYADCGYGSVWTGDYVVPVLQGAGKMVMFAPSTSETLRRYGKAVADQIANGIKAMAAETGVHRLPPIRCSIVLANVVFSAGAPPEWVIGEVKIRGRKVETALYPVTGGLRATVRRILVAQHQFLKAN